MCEIFGICNKNEININGYLKSFYSHSSEHPHGWGLAVEDENNISIEKEPMQASKSNYLRQRLSLPIITKTALAHIRYATIGDIAYKNCHPYSKTDNFSRRWTLIHNGTIFDYPPINKFLWEQKGDTDSERVFLYIVQQINQHQKSLDRLLDTQERFSLLDCIITEMSRGNKLNLLIYDGEYMYVHTNYRNSLHYLENENGTVFSTRPLNSETWERVPMTTLISYKNGRQIFTGTNHGNEYTDDAESMKYLYQIFSNL